MWERRAQILVHMLRTIAVATDGSDTAQRAVSAAFTLARRFDAAVVVLTAYSVDASDGGVWASNSSTQAERVLADAEEAAIAEGLSCTSAMREGDPADVIVGLAARHGADLLVVGNVGMNRRLLGSVPNSVTHKAGCSVLLVKTS
jgi:nucleotide-binding universal stress UspA family protein